MVMRSIAKLSLSPFSTLSYFSRAKSIIDVLAASMLCLYTALTFLRRNSAYILSYYSTSNSSYRKRMSYYFENSEIVSLRFSVIREISNSKFESFSGDK
jgi:hypothetical protein